MVQRPLERRERPAYPSEASGGCSCGVSPLFSLQAATNWQAGQKHHHHIPFRVRARLLLQRPLSLITTPKMPLRYAYKTLDLNH
jgi:hypothetical protein